MEYVDLTYVFIFGQQETLNWNDDLMYKFWP